MLEILIAMSVLILLLAKHGKGKSPRRYSLRKVRITAELALVTLASDTALTVAAVAAAGGAYRLVTVKASYAMRSMAAGDGPLTVGWAHGDYSVTEIKECMEAQAAINQGNKVAQEQANRLIRIVGTFTGGDSTLNDGRPIKTRLNWLITIGQVPNIFAFNEDSGSLTTGALMTVQGDIYIKDSD